MTMGDRITPTRPRRLDPPTVDVAAGPIPVAGSGASLPTQPAPSPAGEPVAAPTT